MKKIYKVLICVLMCSGGFWLLKTHFQAKSPPEVIKIYKAVPVDTKPARTKPVERVEKRTSSAPVSETEGSADSSQTALEDLADTALTPEEIAFLKWFASLETESDTTTMDVELETEAAAVPEVTVEGLTPQEEHQIIDALFPLREVVAAYGGDPEGNGVPCPICSHPDDFYITRDGNSWWCHTCSDGAYDTFEFIARVEGITRDEAYEWLAEQAGLR